MRRYRHWSSWHGGRHECCHRRRSWALFRPTILAILIYRHDRLHMGHERQWVLGSVCAWRRRNKEAGVAALQHRASRSADCAARHAIRWRAQAGGPGIRTAGGRNRIPNRWLPGSVSFMRVLNALARRLGWSPVGKAIVLRIDDASDPTWGGVEISGWIRKVHEDGSAVIALVSPLHVGSTSISALIASPRHKNYAFTSLWSDFIAVNLVPFDKSEEAGRWMATATVRRV